VATRKTCPGCRRALPISAYQKSSTAASGLQTRCRECRAAAAVEYRARTKERRDRYNREWYAANSDRVRARYLAQRPERLRAMRERYWSMTPEERAAENRAGYQSDIEKSRAQRRAWYANNVEARAAYMRSYFEANRSRFGSYRDARTQRIREQFVEEVDALVLLERHDGVCGICGHDVDPLDFHIDHVVPLSRGGEHSYTNTQPAHPLCNKRKGARLPEEVAA
jgi:5-methylcytosine-specific restriction endonuclease McrA